MGAFTRLIGLVFGRVPDGTDLLLEQLGVYAAFVHRLDDCASLDESEFAELERLLHKAGSRTGLEANAQDTRARAESSSGGRKVDLLMNSRSYLIMAEAASQLDVNVLRQARSEVQVSGSHGPKRFLRDRAILSLNIIINTGFRAGMAHGGPDTEQWIDQVVRKYRLDQLGLPGLSSTPPVSRATTPVQDAVIGAAFIMKPGPTGVRPMERTTNARKAFGELRLQCDQCRRHYILGKDALVVSSFGVMNDFAGVVITPSGLDSVAAEPDLISDLERSWATLDASTIQEQETEIRRITSALAAGRAKSWKCYHCGCKQPYRFL